MMKKYISKIKLVLTICFLSTVLFSSCEKEGKEGPQGKDGVEGTQGIAGADGSAVLSGNGAPVSTLGKNGDYYLDKTGISIYGPKTSAGWGQATSLKGDKGDAGNNGKDGAIMLNGVNTPATGLGVNGDFYFETQNMVIYGPKTSAGWGTGVSLKAPEANGVKVVIYKNHFFQNVVRDDSGFDDNLKYYAEQKTENQNQINYYQQEYNQAVANINGSNDSQQNKDYYLAQALQNFNSQTSYYRNNIVQIEADIVKTNAEKVIGRFEISSIIKTDTKYSQIYETGLVLAYFKKSGDEIKTWQTELEIINDSKDYKHFYAYINNPKKGEVNIKGEASLIPESEVKSTKIDIKVVFIPASSVEIMASKNIDTKNVLAVSKFLGISL